MPSDEPDLLELLATDHARIQRLLDSGDSDLDAVTHEIEAHVVGEDQLLYREMREQMQVDDLVDDLLNLDQRMEEALAVSIDVGQAELATVKELFAEHVRRQEAEAFPAVRAAITPERLVQLGGALQTVVRMAPTRPHPHNPDEGWREQLADGVAAIIDQIGDVFRRR